MRSTTRRHVLRSVAIGSIGFLAGCVGSSPEHPVTDTVTSWPSFRGDRTNTGYAKGVTSVSTDPSIKWTFSTDDAVWASPIIANGTVYIGSADTSIYALDADSGDKRWQYQTDHRVEGTATYADGTLYVGSYDTHLYALDAATGDLQWKTELPGLIRGSPTVVEDTVLLGVGCHNLACAWYADDGDAEESGWIYALTTESGEVKWRRDVGDEVVSTPAVGTDTAYLGSSDGHLYAIAIDDGEIRWQFEANRMVWSSPTLAFGFLYFGDWGGLIHAVDADSGDQEWSFDTGGHYISGSTAVDEEAVYVGYTPRNFLDAPGVNYGKVFRLDRETGDHVWEHETRTSEIGSSPVVTDELLYIGTHRPSEHEGAGIHAITTDGEEEWFFEILGRGVGSSPALLNGVLYFGGTDSKVYAIE